MTCSRGTSNGNVAGSAEDRRRRRQWLLDRFGNGATAPCMLGGPSVSWCEVTVNAVTLTVDRIVPGCKGGRYTRDNIQPACGPCNSRQGGTMRSTT